MTTHFSKAYKHTSKLIFTLFMLALAPMGWAQISYEQGYYVTNSGEQVDCYIKNMDWKNNPSFIEIRMDTDGTTNRVEIKDMKGFGLANGTTYLRAKVLMDRSSENMRFLTQGAAPDFKEETLMLKQLVDGEATLYSYKEADLRRFFTQMNQGEITQLVYKKYQKDYNQIGVNHQYKQQLFNHLQCDRINLRDIENMDYQEKDLKDIFIAYNKCVDKDFVADVKEHKTSPFNLSLKAGLRSASLEVKNSHPFRDDATFDNELSFQFGLEAEYILPFNKNKWSLFVEPTYQKYQSDTTNDDGNVSVDYSSVEVPMGMRHYFFLSDTAKLFLEAAVSIDLSGGSKIEFSYDDDVDIESQANVAFGLGFKYNDRFLIQGRVFTARNLVTNYHFISTDYQVAALLIGYTLL